MIPTWLARLLWPEPAPPTPERPPAEWDCTASGWGNSTVVMSVDGLRVRLCGWSPDAWRMRVGDTLILRSPTSGTTRYRLDEITRPGDPRDQWFGVATFCPREVSRGR